MRSSRVRWASLLLLVSLLATLAPAAHGRAQASIEVTSSTATTSFPDAITFELEAGADDTVIAVDLVYQMSELETLQLLPADFEQDGELLTARAEADLEILFLPVGIDLTFRWIVYFTEGESVETGSGVITWLDDRFNWDVREGEDVSVYGYETSRDFLDLIFSTAEESMAELVDQYQPEVVYHVRVWVYDNGEDYSGTLASNSQEWSAGSAYPDLQVIHAVIPDGNESEVMRIIPHEISHQVLHMATLNPYNGPATWIDEGLAVVAQTGAEGLYEDVVERAWRDDELLSMQGLISAFPFNPGDARLAYAQSYSMVTFVIDTWGDEAILEIVNQYAEGSSHDDVLREAVGMNLSELEQRWLASLDDRYGAVAA